MTSALADHPFSTAALDGLIARHGEAPWLSERRREALQLFTELSETPLDPEEYKRLDLRTFRPEKYRLIDTASSLDASGFSTLMRDRAEFGGAVVHVDGRCVTSQLDESLAAKGVLYGDLKTLLESHREVLEPYFLTKAVRPDADRFAAWHAAFWTGGTVLYVPRNVEITAPLYSLIGLQQDEATDLSHTLIILEEELPRLCWKRLRPPMNRTKGCTSALSN
ncbi:MAG: hypothetical protein R3B90_09555 [Planctomycetaceae bacterium]